jgi:hypothetical protein
MKKDLETKKGKGCLISILIFIGFVFLISLFLIGNDNSNIEQIGYWKKNNTRVFSVYTKTTDFQEMKEYGKKQMHTMGRTTTVYFFNNKEYTPDVTLLEDPYQFSKKYEPYWIATYQKYPEGKEEFTKHIK